MSRATDMLDSLLESADNEDLSCYGVSEYDVREFNLGSGVCLTATFEKDEQFNEPIEAVLRVSGEDVILEDGEARKLLAQLP